VPRQEQRVVPGPDEDRRVDVVPAHRPQLVARLEQPTRTHRISVYRSEEGGATPAASIARPARRAATTSPRRVTER